MGANQCKGNPCGDACENDTSSRRPSNLSFRRPSRLPSPTEQRYSSAWALLKDFCNRTSSHGIPFIGAPAFFNRGVWTVITLVCFILFLYQTYWTLSEYFQYRTIIEMQLKFEPAPFPAVTVCNLNPFKKSKLKNYVELFHELEMDMHHPETEDDQEGRNRSKRDEQYDTEVKYAPVFVRCSCVRGSEHCIPQRNPLERNTTVCVCFEDISTGNIWPCYPQPIWTEKKCFGCSISNTCEDPGRPNATRPKSPARGSRCLCQSVSHNCVVMPEEEISWWDPNNYFVFNITTTTPAPVISEENTTRTGATAKNIEKKLYLMSRVAAMSREARRNLSYTLHEFVMSCSFNSKECELERDFKLHMDPEYGNCYTFNFNDSVELKNSRAGPMYGLRLLLNVNQSDYLMTTEAAGVRLVVHEQDQEPFPDTFGYSAPTGFVSSFGLKTKVIHRLDAPYGKCSDTFRPAEYIYEEHYSPEGCYRNCFQHSVLSKCNCGDPRFPLPSDAYHTCDASNFTEGACLEKLMNVTGGFHHLEQECNCVQPCNENVFETAYSCSAWPATNFKILKDHAGVPSFANNSERSTEYYRVNTAYIEIYYEQLNFETLRETVGYSIVNLFSDFGGNIGLWIGFSIITVMEIMELICELVYYMAIRRPMQLMKKKKRRQMNQLSRPQLHYRAETSSMFSKQFDPSVTIDSNLDFDDSEMIDSPPHR